MKENNKNSSIESQKEFEENSFLPNDPLICSSKEKLKNIFLSY